MKIFQILMKIADYKLFWVVLFVLSLFLKIHPVVQVLLFLVMVLGLGQFQNLLLYWLYRLSRITEIPLPWGPLKLPNETETELPREFKSLDSDDVYLSNKLLEKAKNSFNAGNWQEAITLAHAAIEKYPKNYEANLFLGFIYDLNPINQPDKAVVYSKKALEIKPESFIPQFNLAVATNHVSGSEISLQEYLKAEEAAKREGVDINSEIMGKLNLFLAHDYKNTKQYDEALKRYAEAEKILSALVTKGDRTSQHWLDAALKGKQEVEQLKKGKENE